jgi:fumarate reductase subunit D
LGYTVNGSNLDGPVVMRTKRSPQPFLWLLFGAGGTVTALLAPIIFLLFGVIFPLGLVVPPRHDHLLAMLDRPLIRVMLLGVCVLALFHSAYRFYYILRDGLRLKRSKKITSIACYGGAITGSIIASYILLHA